MPKPEAEVLPNSLSMPVATLNEKYMQINVNSAEDPAQIERSSFDSPATIRAEINKKERGETMKNLMQLKPTCDDQILAMPESNSQTNLLAVKKSAMSNKDGDSFYGSENEQSQSSWCDKSSKSKVEK